MSNYEDRFLLNLSYWTWAPLDVFFEMADDVGATLSSLPQKEWSTLLSFLPHALDRHAVRAPINQPLPQKLRSHRLAFLVGIKAPRAYGRAVFLDYFQTDAGESTPRLRSFGSSGLWKVHSLANCRGDLRFPLSGRPINKGPQTIYSTGCFASTPRCPTTL